MRNLDVAGTGFTVLDKIYATGSPNNSMALGGSCGNVLLSLAMLRRRVAPILTLGFDEAGRRLINEFEGAGAEMSFVRCRHDRSSPVLAQIVDPRLGAHSFAWTCPATSEALPRFTPVAREEVESAIPALERAAVFFVDRLTDAVVNAMELAMRSGVIVFFEPSEVGEQELFDRAVAASSILKFSADRLGEFNPPDERTVTIVTHGEAGLELRHAGERRWLEPFPARDVRDTCGSGDMVSVGLIHWLLTLRPDPRDGLDLAAVIPGVRSGQRLAAENCAYVGARGLFRQRGAEFARAVLEA